MIMRKHPRNDTENPPGQIISPHGAEHTKEKRREALEELTRISQELGLYEDFEKPLVKEISDYEELLRRNNSENSR